MEFRIVFLTFACVFLVHNVLAETNKNTSTSNPIPHKSSSKDELFIDDEADEADDPSKQLNDSDDMMLGEEGSEEGSGMGPPSKGTGVEDMESSGSGYGPDDEDAHDTSNKAKNKTHRKPDIDSEDEDDIIDDDEEEEDSDDFDKEKSPTNNVAATTTSSTTTSTTTTTTENYDEESRILEETKQKTNTDDVNVAPAYVPESPKTTSTSTLPPPPSNAIDDHSSSNGVYISPNSHPERTSSFFAQPGILAAVIGGAVVGLLCAILVVMFIVYRMRKKDEGSYPLEETKRSPATNPYLKSTHREFYA